MTQPSAPFATRFSRWLPWLLGGLALLPFLANLQSFETLFYFEDEIELVDRMDQTGFLPWTFGMFTESWVPLFKLVWGGVIVATGSYFLLLVLLWLNHAFNVVLIAKLVRKLGAGPWAAVFAAVWLGLPWYNIETLAWSVQWTAVVSLTFLVLGLHALADDAAGTPQPAWKLGLVLALLSFASATCFVRGILTGPTFAAVVLLSQPQRAWRKRAAIAAVAVLPMLLVCAVIFRAGQGNHQQLSAQLGLKLQFAYTYFAQCPWRWLTNVEWLESRWLALAATLKLAVFLAGWRLAPRALRPVILGLLATELGNALLLGIGRFHTGMNAAASWRYQYLPLLTTAVPAALAVDAWLRFLARPVWLRPLVATGASAALAWHVAAPWRGQMSGWCGWRGAEFRAGLAAPPEQAPPNFSRLPYIDNARAHALVKKYHLR